MRVPDACLPFSENSFLQFIFRVLRNTFDQKPQYLAVLEALENTQSRL